MRNRVNRRDFLKDSATGVSAFAATIGKGTGNDEGAPRTEKAKVNAENSIGRPVRVVSIGFGAGRLPLERIAELVHREGKNGADLIALPETCRGQNQTSQESLDGPTISAMRRLARTHGTYVVCPIDRRDGSRRFNSAVLLDRRGKVACIYNKLYPVWLAECVDHHVIPGKRGQVCETDFGRIGLSICFDVNWTPPWRDMANMGAQLVVWPSAYSAGRSLQMRAIQYNYYIVSATWTPDCLVYDIDGQQLLYESNNQGDGINISRVTLDFDRCIFHQDQNLPHKLARLLKERGEDVTEEKWMPLEGWFVLKAKRPKVRVRELARQYGLEELRHYLNRSRCEIDKARGWELS